MNTGMVTFQSIFAEGLSAAPVIPKPLQTSKAGSSVPPSGDRPASTNHLETEATDNNQTVAQTMPVSDPPQNFREALRKKIEPKPGQEDQDKAEPKIENSTSEAVPAANAAQVAVAQKIATGVTSAEKGTAAEVNGLCQHQAHRLI